MGSYLKNTGHTRNEKIFFSFNKTIPYIPDQGLS